MKKFLPKTLNNPQGFTLVELLVVITIIAILSVVGIAVFGNVQKTARDSRRKADIDSIAKALEVAKIQTSNTYSALATTQFASGNIPTDPISTRSYCADSETTQIGVLAANPVNWTSSCPGGFTPVAVANPPAATYSWKVCTALEDTALSPNVICFSNQQ